jgi:hypothetical protein
MRLTTSIKLTFVTIFTCLGLILGIFASTGVASAHSTTALQNKASTSQSDALGRNRHCRIRVIETVVFVPFNNQWNNWGMNNGWNNQWNNNQWQQNQNMSFWQNNSNFDSNQGDFENFSGFGQRNVNGFFIVKVTEIKFCNGHHSGQRNFEFQDN